MTDLRKAAEMALDALKNSRVFVTSREKTKHPEGTEWYDDCIEALRQALAQPEQEPVTLLPDGSAFGVMSFPLPKSHWLYAEREYRDGEYEPVELGKPILAHELRSAVVSAVRYAIRGATNCGKEMDFDPDALVQNAVYALCGPYTASVDAVNMSQERVDETAKGEQEPVAWIVESKHGNWAPYLEWSEPTYLETQVVTALYARPQAREWVGLTHEEKEQATGWSVEHIEAKLKEKNCG